MEEKKLTYRDFIDMVRADNEAKNADRATRKNLYVDAKNKYEDYLRGEWKKDKQSIEEKKYVNEAGQFDFKKFVADGALEKNLNEAKDVKEFIRDRNILDAPHTRAGVRKDMSPQEEYLRGYMAIRKTFPLTKKFGIKYD